MQPFEVVHKDAVPHGILAGVSLPGVGEPVPPAVLSRLLPEEREFAATLRGFRQPEWVGGRLAARDAFRTLGRRVGPLLTDAYGAPETRSGVAVSISHKRTLAVALVAQRDIGSIGVDLEDLSPPRMSVAPRVLLPEELAEIEALASERQWTSVLIRFSVKEAIYKALAPRLRRYIRFDEALVFPDTDCTARVELRLDEGDAVPSIDARYAWLGQAVLTTVRVRWPAATKTAS